MADTSRPVLVYNRIDANRRKTRLLVTSFALAFLPAVSGIAAFFIVPWIYLINPPTILDDRIFNHLQGLPPAFFWLYAGAGVNLISMAIVVLALVAATVFLTYRYGSRVVLRVAHARPVDPGQHRDLVNVVENLCIAAGLPLPRIHVIESAAPNAFATGRNPHDACLVVTRGLLELLDRRELEGVIAHELSHIGNHDIGLGTTLAALVGTLSLPLKVLSAPLCWVYIAFGMRKGLQFVGMVVSILFVLSIEEDTYRELSWTISGITRDTIPLYIWWWWVYVTISGLYAVFVAPVVALLIRQAVSRQREFLADADAALLTRDPEGLALALVKIGAVGGKRLRVGEGTVHLYFVDPRSKGSWLHRVFPSHPSLERRVELLARMGNGIAPSAIQAARDAGARVRASSGQTAEPTGTSDHELTPLYEQPDGWSRVIAQLPESAVVIPIATEGRFIRVTTAEHQAGYVSRSARLTALKNFR